MGTRPREQEYTGRRLIQTTGSCSGRRRRRRNDNATSDNAGANNSKRVNKKHVIRPSSKDSRRITEGAIRQTKKGRPNTKVDAIYSGHRQLRDKKRVNIL